MKSKNKKQFFSLYCLLVFLLLMVSILINLNWIKNDERPISHEDQVLLNSLPILYSHNLNLYKKI